MAVGKQLSAKAIASPSMAPGMHADGDGLYLIVSPQGAKRWTFVFFMQGKRKEMGLGKLSAVSLLDARDAADAARRMVARGENPIEARRANRADAAAEAGKVVVTFGMAAEAHINAHASGYRNAKHIDQWRMTLSVQRDKAGNLMDTGYCLAIRDTAVAEIDTPEVMSVLLPVWLDKAETASRIRGRIEHVLDAAKVDGHRSGENPARWRGHLKLKLPKRRKLTRGHHAAMPYVDVADFITELHKVEGLGAQALELAILTASRTGEIITAKWHEFDMSGKVWTVPAERMKAGREHRVPLSARAHYILGQLAETRTGDYVFPGKKANAHISNATMSKALGAAGGSDFTVHGFRSAFRDWVGEETSFAEAIAEAALAHIIGDETERAYRRGDALAKRKTLMDAWAAYCLPAPVENVLPMTRRKPTAA
ncbi:tyrosine-type recombinase/integrase [Devosia psychrophila]|uniref:Integrase n=1 Tax=Devosia psychrophila TaxID=728005 RepID=A0A0F5Q141_9HYPH|nr:site-specific integrase [Devosia psychrophila]KKC34608.1 integrase [Devosia psychrophila]SFD00673.1 Integrase [Devosia psychrophila]